MRKTIIPIFLLFLMTIFSNSAHAFDIPLVDIEGAVGVWNHAPTGSINYNGNEDIQLEEDLNIGTRYDWQAWLRVEHPIPVLPDIKIQYTPIQFDDDNASDKAFTFGDKTYEIGDPLHSELELDMLDVILYWHIPLLKTVSMDKLDINLGVALKYLDGRAQIEAVNRNKNEEQDFSIPLPVGFLGLRITPIDLFTLMLEGKAIAYDQHHWYDALVELQIAPIENIFIGVGYRYQDFKVDDINDITASQTMQGLFGEIGFRL